METELVNRDELAFKALYDISQPELKTASDEDLREFREKLILAMDDLVSKADAAKRSLSEDESRAYNYAETAVTKIKRELDKREAGRPQRVPGGLGKIVSSEDAVEYEEKSHVGKVGLSYRSLFHKGTTGELDNGGFRSHEEFYRVLASGKYDPRIAKRTHVSGIGSLGGVSVSDNLANIIWSVPLEKGVVMPRARIFPIAAGNSITVPYFDGFDHQTDGLFGGFTGQWLGEAVTSTEQNARLQDVSMSAYKLAIFTGASNELLTDSLTFESSIGDAMKQAVNFKLDEAFLTGDGVAKPIGALVSPSAITLNRATTGTITYSDITAMYGRMHPACYANAVWIVSPSAVPALCAMVDAGNHTLWVMNASQGVPGTIFGLPVIVSEKLAALGSTHDIALVDFSQYGVVMRKEIVLEKTNAMHFTSDVSDFRCIVRVNGRSLWASAVTPAAGGATLSWCVSLNA